MNTTTKELIDFIASSPTAFHAVDTVIGALKESGYRELKECQDWTLIPGGRYYVTRNLSALIAFTLPESGRADSFLITAAHSDSPSFKIKSNPESETVGYVKINTERYGGMLCSTWMDRPLSAAGRIVCRENGRIVTKLVDLKRDLFMIPSVAIHMNRSANEGASYNAATDMQPICGSSSSKGEFLNVVAETAGVSMDDIIGTDLYLYPKTPGTVWGMKEEFISSPRLDDLQCVYSAVKAHIGSKPSSSVPMVFVSDNEEVGSSTKQGADSTFLSDTVKRIIYTLGGNETDCIKALSSSFMVSADNAHAVHPNHPEYADPSHRPVMNGGIVIKHAASQTYTTDAVSCAVFEEICRRASVPTQHFANRSDMRGGSTLGNISGTQVSINTVDIGLPQLAMHSSYETAGALDTEYLVKALTEFFSSAFRTLGDGEYEII